MVKVQDIILDVLKGVSLVPRVIFQGVDSISSPHIKGRGMKELGVVVPLS